MQDNKDIDLIHIFLRCRLCSFNIFSSYSFFFFFLVCVRKINQLIYHLKCWTNLPSAMEWDVVIIGLLTRNYCISLMWGNHYLFFIFLRHTYAMRFYWKMKNLIHSINDTHMCSLYTNKVSVTNLTID